MRSLFECDSVPAELPTGDGVKAVALESLRSRRRVAGGGATSNVCNVGTVVYTNWHTLELPHQSRRVRFYRQSVPMEKIHP